MPLSQPSLATELESLVPVADTIQASLNLSQAYGDYIKNATANAVPVSGTFVDLTCVPAMASAMAFLSDDTPASAAAKIVAGCSAFWAPAITTPFGFISGATVLVPPTFAALAVSLAATFVSNAGGADFPSAMDALATDIHAATLISPTAQFGVPVFPIL